MTHHCFIEADFPIRAVTDHAAREKNIRPTPASPTLPRRIYD